MHDLHEDVLRVVLDFCSASDVRRLALVSKRLRPIAIANANFSLSCPIELAPFGNEKTLPSAFERMDYSLAFQLPLSVSVSWHDFSVDPDSLIQSTMGKVLRVRLMRITSLLKFLDVSLPWQLFELLQSAFEQPCPLLRQFDIFTFSPRSSSAFILSPKLFHGNTTALRSVKMINVAPPDTLIAAFTNVRDLELRYTGNTPSIDFSIHFPAASIIKVILYGLTHANSEIDLRGFTPQRLHLRYENDRGRLSHIAQHLLNITRIHTISWSVYITPYEGYHWIGLPTGDVSIHVGQMSQIRARVVAFVHCNGMQRNVIFNDPTPTPLTHALRTFVARIVDMRLDVDAVPDWLDIFVTQLPALERLHLEFNGFHDHWSSLEELDLSFDEQRLGKAFPALRAVLLTSRFDGIDIKTKDVVRLGRMLGQANRSPDMRSTLQIFGLEVEGDHDLLGSMFSVVTLDCIERVWRASPLDLSGSCV